MTLGNYIPKDFIRLEHKKQLENCIQEMQSSDNTTLCGLLVSGYTGTGKTFFVENYLREQEGLFPVLVARHNQQHEDIPYFGFKSGVSDFLNKVYKQFSRPEFTKFSDQLKAQVGDSFPLLLDYIPELSVIAGKESGYTLPSVPKIENQLYPLFKLLFEFIADYYRKPVFLFTDDLQWIDGSGINLLKYLIVNLSPHKLLWIGGCRAPHEKVSAVAQLSDALSFEKKHIQNILLDGLNADQGGEFMKTVLGNSCDGNLVKVCYELSGGNPSHLLVLLESLKKSNLIWQRNGIWYGDERAVIDRFKGQDSRIILRKRFRKLSEPTQEMLSIMACMGMFSQRTLSDWIKEFQLSIDELIVEAMEAGLIEEKENRIRFSEMHMGEMIYEDLSLSKRSQLHYKIAKLIYARGLDQLNGTKVTLMTTHFNQSLPLVKSNGELLMCAELNYQAGAYAKQDNALDQARYFFKKSADLLKECPRGEVLDQLWLVYLERAKVEYHLGEHDLAEIHLDYLLEILKHPLKRASAYELKIIINSHLGRYRMVVEILRESLRELGVELPSEEIKLIEEVGNLKHLLSAQERKMENARDETADVAYQKAILNLLNVGGMGLHHTSDVLMTWAALQIITRSGTEKVSGVKAIGYVSYGRMLIISGNIDQGIEYGAKGLALNKSLDDINLRCRVYGVYAFYIKPWQNHYGDSMQLLEKGIEAGRKSGDLIGLYILKTHQFNLHFLSGLSIKELLKWDFDESFSDVELTYYITHYQKSLIRFLIGESPIFSIPRQQPSWLAGKLTIQEEKFYRNYVWGRYYFLFGHYELAEIAAKEANANKKLQEGSPLVPANQFIWFLSITQNWNNFSSDITDELVPQLQEILKSFKLWHANAPSNYNAHWWLMNAEWSRINGDSQRAEEYFNLSINTAGRNSYNTALAYELFARHLLNTASDLRRAAKHLLKSIDFYNEWGALAKSKQLIQQYQSILIDHYSERQQMDIETIQHELSGDLEVASLVKKLLVLLLRISGSTRVVIESVEKNGEFNYYGDISLFHNTHPDSHISESTGIPVSLGLMAYRLQEPVVVNDLELEKGGVNLESVRQRNVKSFVIIPVTINGHFSLVISLENAFLKNWYTSERIKWIRITANQGAVIIENARIYEKSLRLNEEIRREMTEKERLASIIESQKDLHLKDLVETQESERKRIASDLHDSLGSMLSSVKLRFNNLQEDMQKDFSVKNSTFSDTVTLLDEAIQELRRIAHNMSPVALKRFGLKPAIHSFLEQINIADQLDVDLQILGLDRRLPEEYEIAAYRICQELVQNVIRHSQSPSMNIQIIGHHDSLNIIIEDKGIGMDKEKIKAGFGFNTIQLKVSLLKGSFAIESQPGKGTMVLVDFPLDFT